MTRFFMPFTPRLRRATTRFQMIRTMTAPKVEPNSPTPSLSPKSAAARKPPTNDPTMPSTIVASRPMGSRPGTMRRARSAGGCSDDQPCDESHSAVLPTRGGHYPRKPLTNGRDRGACDTAFPPIREEGDLADGAADRVGDEAGDHVGIHV